MDIHQQYRIAYEAALNAQLTSLNAELEARKRWTLNTHMQLECQVIIHKINALTLEVRRLNQ